MTNHLFDGLLGKADPQTTLAYLEDGFEQTYGSVIATSGRLANALVEIGVRPNDRVAVQVP